MRHVKGHNDSAHCTVGVLSSRSTRSGDSHVQIARDYDDATSDFERTINSHPGPLIHGSVGVREANHRYLTRTGHDAVSAIKDLAPLINEVIFNHDAPLTDSQPLAHGNCSNVRSELKGRYPTR